MRDTMQIGDRVFFYHSSCAQPGITGICRVCSEPTRMKPSLLRNPYFDPKSVAG